MVLSVMDSVSTATSSVSVSITDSVGSTLACSVPHPVIESDTNSKMIEIILFFIDVYSFITTFVIDYSIYC